MQAPIARAGQGASVVGSIGAPEFDSILLIVMQCGKDGSVFHLEQPPMPIVAGRNRVNRPYFFTDVDGERVEFPAFGEGIGELEGRELSRFNMYVRDRQIEATTAIPPAAFGSSDWSVDGDTVTIIALPDDNGYELTGIAIRVDGGDVSIVDPETGDYPLGLDPGEYSIDIAAISEAGQSPWSDPKTTEVVA